MDDFNVTMKKAAQILDRTAGVVDTNGRIVSCTDPSMVGDLLPIGEKLMESEDVSTVADDTAAQKLVVGGQSEYAAFIEGSDTVSQTYLSLIVGWLETALSESSTDAERENLLKNILLENELPGDIPLKAREYKIPYAALRVCYLIHVEEGDSLECREILSNLYPNRKQDYLLAMDEESIVLLKEINRAERDQIEEMGLQMLDTINTESMSKVRIGIGMPAETLKDCAKSYREASLSLTVGEIFEPESYLMRYDQLGLGRLIYQLPPTLCHMFLDEVFPDGSYEQLDDETLLTIDKFFENNLNGSETSRQLFVHRNTLVYRLDKVEKITGLDLRKFEDAVLFKLASMVRKYLEKMDSSSLKDKSNKWWRN